MKVYDISQEVFSCVVFGKDPAPEKTVLASIKDGDPYNLIKFSMCAHNGTHVDAPAHFLPDGRTVETLPLDKTVGYATVVAAMGELTAADARDILTRARAVDADAAKRILLKGNAAVTAEAAAVFVAYGTLLIGTETQSVGPADAPMAVHRTLLSAEIALLEGIRLDCVPEGRYLLFAAPLSLGGADGAPCRAVLVKE